MDIKVGTSSWYFEDDENLIYPETIKPREKLEYYSKEFDLVEVNTTFYHFPRKTTIEKWLDETGESFKFIIKLNRYFTHKKKLIMDEESIEKLEGFLKLIEGLENKLAGLLIQLPPSFKINLGVLKGFLEKVNSFSKIDVKVFLEIRNDSWLTEDFFDLLKKEKANLVYNDSGTNWPQVLKLTGDTLYLRLHGREKLYYSSYSREELEEILNKIKEIDNDAYIFMNNTANISGIKNALLLKEMIK